MSRVTPHLLRSALVAALGSFLFGFDTAVISGTTDALRSRFALDSSQLGLTVASALVGTVLLIDLHPGGGVEDSSTLIGVLLAFISATGYALIALLSRAVY